MDHPIHGPFEMELAPSSAPVYGGGLIEVEILGDVEVNECARLFMIFEGSKQRQITEAKVLDNGRLQAVIPDHEPPEVVDLTLIVRDLGGEECKVLAQETFTYFLDQTCYLARYLADSVHDLEALEDWDYIQGPQFSLADEDFPTLDERLTSAFQHLILPPNWNLLGDPATGSISRETLFHFAARLGLSSFVTLLLEKNGAVECLEVHNKHNELARNIARSKSYDGLADLITDPHAHGVIRWESTHRMTPTTVVKRHSFGTVTTSTEMQNGDFLLPDEEIDLICKEHPPPPPDKPGPPPPEIDEDPTKQEEDEKEYEIPDEIGISNTTNATWGSEDASIEIPSIPPPVPPKPQDFYMNLEGDGGANNESHDYPQDESSLFFSPNSYVSNSVDYTDEDSSHFHEQDTRLRAEKTGSEEILGDNLRHLQRISTDIQYIRQKDIARLQQSSPTDGRLSNSCPNLGQDASFLSADTDYMDDYDSPAAARSRHALPAGVAMDNLATEYPGHLGSSYPAADDIFHSGPHNRSPLYIADAHPELLRQMQDTLEDDTEDAEGEDESSSREEDEEKEELSQSGRPHSWHSDEKLNADVPDTVPAVPKHVHKRSKSYQGDESQVTAIEEVTPEERAEEMDTVVSPSVRRVRHHNNSTFAVIGPRNGEQKRATSLSMNNNNNAGHSRLNGQRFTISEGLITDEQRNSLRKLQEYIRQHDALTSRSDSEDGEDDCFSSGPKQMSLSEFLSDPANFELDESSTEITTGYAAKPPVPEGPAAKKNVYRKLSFLTKMRNSTRTKSTSGKERTKKVPEIKFHPVRKSDDNIADGKDKDTLRDLAWHPVKNKPKKGNNSTQRPQSMMISKTTIYGPPSLASNGFPSGINHRVHGLPVPQSMARPISTFESGRTIESSVSEVSRSSKNSYKDEDSTSIHSGSRTPPHLSQFNTISGSMESIDDAVDLSELENDPDLIIKEEEPEAWSVTVDKKMLKKMNKRDIKRQDNIFEFIQKERNFLTTLKIMQKIFARGMSREVQTDQEVIDKMFPQIDEFVEFTSVMVQQLDERQQKGQVLDKIGDILVQHWSGENGRRMLWLFSDFCSKQNEIVSMYKDMLKNDKKFQDFTRKCSKNPLTRRRDIPGCILLVTQRITKYPVILKTLIDNSRKEHGVDCADLNYSLELIKEIITKVDQQVLEYEKQQKLKDICQRMESKTYATYKDGRKFSREDLLHSVRNLLQAGNMQWKVNATKRPTEVTILLFTDCLVFLQENNQRFTFPSVGQPAIVPLHKLIVREKAGEDNVLFILSASSNQPEMYELVCSRATDSKNWMKWIRSAADKCPEEDEGVSHEEVEEQRLMEQKWERAHQLIAELDKRDEKINKLLKEKMQKFEVLVKVVDRPEVTSNMKFRYPTYTLSDDNSKSSKLPSGTPILQRAIEQVNKLSYAMCGPGGLSRNPSSVGEHESGTFLTTVLPKRSETFGGFDNGKEPPSPRSKWPMSLSKLTSKQDSSVSSSDESKRDSGLIEGEISIHGSDVHLGGDSSSNSSPMATVGRGVQGVLVPPTTDQVSALAQLTHLMNEYLSVATQQDTHVEKMNLKMAQARDKLSNRRRLGGNLQEVEARRNHLKQSELEQELLRKEEQLKSERDQWDRQCKRYQTGVEKEKREFEQLMDKLKKDEIEVQRQQEEVKRAKEECQRQMVRLRELQRKATHQDGGMLHSSSFPSSLANKNNNNSAANTEELESYTEEDRGIKSRTGSNLSLGSGLSSMPASLSKSHSSLEGDSNGETGVSKDSSHSPTYTNSGDYPRTFPGVTKRDQSSFFSQTQHHNSVQPPIPSAATHGPQLPIHLQYSATNLVTGHAAPISQNRLPSKLMSSSKSTNRTSQVIPTKLSKLATSSGLASSQSSQKHTITDSLKSKLPFSHHKKTPRSTNSSSDLVESLSTKGNALSIPNNLKHSKSEAHIDVSNNRYRSTSSPAPVNLSPPDSALERSNSASSNSSKEGEKDKKKKSKRGSWGSNSDKQNGKEIYF